MIGDEVINTTVHPPAVQQENRGARIGRSLIDILRMKAADLDIHKGAPFGKMDTAGHTRSAKRKGGCQKMRLYGRPPAKARGQGRVS